MRAKKLGAHVNRAEQQLHAFLETLIANGARAGELRSDVAAEELAGYCLHALSAAGTSHNEEAVHRLVAVTIAGLRPD